MYYLLGKGGVSGKTPSCGLGGPKPAGTGGDAEAVDGERVVGAKCSASLCSIMTILAAQY